MRVIGITGGVGAGKSSLLDYIAGKYNCRVILADEAAHRVKEPGQPCYRRLVELLSAEILKEDGSIDRGRMAERIFRSEELLGQVNNIIHPAVKELILSEIAHAREEGRLDFLFVEAALLIENGYLDIVDEMWYIYASEETRRRRLRETRGYSDEKITSILSTQLRDEEFRKACSLVIDNSAGFSQACREIDDYLQAADREAFFA